VTASGASVLLLLEMRDVAKSFGATRALDGVSLCLAAGEVRALIGENGAGKSTLMKVLSGAVRPDSGSMTLGGERYAPRNPREARARGVAMIYQELALAPHLSVEANVMLGQERVRRGIINRAEHRRLVSEALALLEHPDIHPDARVGDLGVGAQQLVEVARALLSNARVIVFDEPTSTLSERDALRLFTIIDRLRRRGLGIIYISHFLEEVRRVAQTYTVVRDGRAVAAGDLAGAPMQSIIAQMVGRDLDELFPHVPHAQGEPILELEGLRAGKSANPARLALHRGEILGLAGLVGAGRTTLLRAIFGLRPVAEGSIRVGRFVGGYAPPRTRIAQGVGFSSEDRKGEGLALSRSIEDNVTYSALARHARWGWLKLNERRRRVAEWMSRLRVSATGPGQAVAALSGGNQQKVALARLLHQEADVLLLDEPTRGIDVGSKAEIYRMIGELAAGGKGILVVSSYLPELFGICDRIAVMSRGAICEARPVSAWTEHEVMEFATGGLAGGDSARQIG
jgi:ribose transport system ATP-binding protein